MTRFETLVGALSPFRAATADRAMVLVILALAALGMAWERLPTGDGIGWDGAVYARMVRDLGGMVAGGELSPYHAQRVLPALVVRGLLGIVGAEPSDLNVVRAFGLYNLALLVLSCLLWRRIADLYRLGIAGRWIGFCGLFLSFQAAKLTFYYPVLTDGSALAFGLLTLWLHARDLRIPLMLASIIGAFCWPTLSLCGALLLLFPRPDRPVEEVAPRPRAGPLLLLSLGLGLSCLVLYLAIKTWPETSCALLDRGLDRTSALLGEAASRALQSSKSLSEPCLAARQLLTALPSVLGLGLALALMLLPLLSWSEMKRHLSRLRPLGVLCAALTIAVPIVVVRLIADPNAVSPSSLKYIALIILLPAEGKFLMPLVGAFVYWGPLVLVIALLWRDFSAAVRGMGLGVALTIALTSLFGLVGEGRFLTAAWPFMVLAIAVVLERRALGRRFWVPFLVLTVLLAQFWLPLNVGPWEGGPYDDLLAFPKQMYFMHFGPWMNWPAFAAQFVLMLVAAVWLASALSGGAAAPPPRTPR